MVPAATLARMVARTVANSAAASTWAEVVARKGSQRGEKGRAKAPSIEVERGCRRMGPLVARALPHSPLYSVPAVPVPSLNFIFPLSVVEKLLLTLSFRQIASRTRMEAQRPPTETGTRRAYLG